MDKGHVWRITLLEILAQLELSEGRTTPAKALLDEAVPLRLALLVDSPAQFLASYESLAGQFRRLSNHDVVATHYRLALDAWRARSRTSQDFAAAASVAAGRAADSLEVTGKLDRAEQIYREAIALRESVYGADHAVMATLHNNLGYLFGRMGRYRDALRQYGHALKINETTHGRDSLDVATNLNNLAAIHDNLGDLDEALGLYQRSLAIRNAKAGNETAEVGETLANMAVIRLRQGALADAERLARQALDISRKIHGPGHPRTGIAINNLASVLERQGRFAEAEPLMREGLHIIEKVRGPRHPDVASALANLGTLLDRQGRHDQAAEHFRRSLEIRRAVLPSGHPDVAVSLNQLAAVLAQLEQYRKAKELLEKALEIDSAAFGKRSLRVARIWANLAALAAEQKQFDEASHNYGLSLAIRERKLGPDHPLVATLLGNIANVEAARTNYPAARRAYRRALDIQSAALGRNHPDVAWMLLNWGGMELAEGNWQAAYDHLRRGADILFGRSAVAKSRLGRPSTIEAATEAQQSAEELKLLIKAAGRIKTDSVREQERLGRDMFKAVQWITETKAGASLAQMSARQAAADQRLAGLVRARQDATRDWRRLDELRLKPVAETSGGAPGLTPQVLRRKQADLEFRVDEIDQKLSRDFPNYASISNPEPTSVADTQSLLGADEALLVFLDTDATPSQEGETFIWLVTRSHFEWRRVSVSSLDLLLDVATLRSGLDPSEGGFRGTMSLDIAQPEPKSSGASGPTGFNPEVAYKLYNRLLAPFEATLADKKHLLLVPSGALTALPFYVLQTRPLVADQSGRRPWLIRRHAITTLPGVSALAALRRNTQASKAPRTYLALADPVFDPARRAQSSPAPRDIAQARRGFVRFLRNGHALQASLNGLARLPDTRVEVNAIARLLDGSHRLLLGDEVTETAVKSGLLSTYKIIHFATHGLVAGELAGLAEPALALSQPGRASDVDDGLLTSSEVGSLHLDADWVILSACNTAAGDQPGAEALSGLARAFLYAGSRALLVSHWPVYSSAAVTITTETFRHLQRQPGIGRAEALRRAMLVLADAPNSAMAHPSYWAPFSVIGDGR